MFKYILLMLGAIVVNYLPVWAADQYDQIIGNAERPRHEIEEEKDSF